jgi:hypothetical protein
VSPSRPSPEALAEAARIYRELLEDEFGVRVVPAEPGDPDALVLRSPPDGGEAGGDVGELRPRRRRRDLNAQ